MFPEAMPGLTGMWTSWVVPGGDEDDEAEADGPAIAVTSVVAIPVLEPGAAELSAVAGETEAESSTALPLPFAARVGVGV